MLRYAGKHASRLARWGGYKREWWRRFGYCQYGIMGVLGQPGEFGQDILRQIIALLMPEMVRGWIYLGHVFIRRGTL